MSVIPRGLVARVGGGRAVRPLPGAIAPGPLRGRWPECRSALVAVAPGVDVSQEK